jgi:hypothetical protein
MLDTPRFDRAKADMQISWLGKRLREPSTYAGLAVILGALHFGNTQDWIAALSSIGIGIGGIIAILLPEKK